MLVLVLCAIALVSPLVVGRWSAGMLAHRWRYPLLIWVTLIVQTVALEVEMPHVLAATLHVVTYAVAVGFLWLNRHVAGARIVATGVLTNGLVIALNGGTLPASRSAVEATGRDSTMEFANTAVLDNPVLPWLGDVFAWPAPMPLANTFSVGDVLIVVGVWVAAWTGTRRLGAPAARTDSAEARNS